MTERRLHQQLSFLLTLKQEDAVLMGSCGVSCSRGYWDPDIDIIVASVEDFALDHGNITVMNYAVSLMHHLLPRPYSTTHRSVALSPTRHCGPVVPLVVTSFIKVCSA